MGSLPALTLSAFLASLMMPDFAREASTQFVMVMGTNGSGAGAETSLPVTLETVGAHLMLKVLIDSSWPFSLSR